MRRTARRGLLATGRDGAGCSSAGVRVHRDKRGNGGKEMMGMKETLNGSRGSVTLEKCESLVTCALPLKSAGSPTPGSRSCVVCPYKGVAA